jgi:SAM-dependent methyltransferase
MDLRSLVELRRSIADIYSVESAIAEIDRIEFLLESLSAAGNELDYVSPLVADLSRSRQALIESRATFDSVDQKLQQDISKLTGKFFDDDYEGKLKRDYDLVRELHVLKVGKEIEDHLLNRIRACTNWKYPALEIGCRDTNLTQYMVAADPLYIADPCQEFVDSTMKVFNSEYQRRLRPYVFPDHDLGALPAGQFGFVLSWNYLNYCSMRTVKKYITQVKDLLRPGGTFIFSYNNGDLPGCIDLAEMFFMGYVPRSQLLPWCRDLGLEISADHVQQDTISWLELRKPGKLETIKLHQVLGEIRRIGN